MDDEEEWRTLRIGNVEINWDNINELDMLAKDQLTELRKKLLLLWDKYGELEKENAEMVSLLDSTNAMLDNTKAQVSTVTTERDKLRTESEELKEQLRKVFGYSNEILASLKEEPEKNGSKLRKFDALLLQSLDKQPSQRLTDMATSLLRDKSNVGARMAILMTLGFVTRDESKRYSLTSTGKLAVDSYMQKI